MRLINYLIETAEMILYALLVLFMVPAMAITHFPITARENYDHKIFSAIVGEADLSIEAKAEMLYKRNSYTNMDSKSFKDNTGAFKSMIKAALIFWGFAITIFIFAISPIN